MRLKHYPSEKLKQDIGVIVRRNLDSKKYKVFFFGSRVAGTATDRSDIDIGIEGAEPVPSGAWLEIQEAIENIPTLYKIEVVDFKRISPLFREVALQHQEPIQISP